MATAGVSSQRHLDGTMNAFNHATQALKAKRERAASLLAQLGGDPNISIDTHPEVQQAKANLHLAELNLSYTAVTAPMNGIVTKVDQLQVGDYVRAGEALWSLISTEDVWVEANFKETEITYMRPGQSVKMVIDAYRQKALSEKILSISPGTGSTFSLLPPENATGNWIKIVQRVPVRISLHDPALRGRLRSGLSVYVTVDTEHRRL
jgi:membrane fusion protein (multidrug efflux system)